MTSLPFELKRLFLNFLQEYFKQTSTKYYWSPDLKTTKIAIVDKYAFDPTMTERVPAIILSRASMQWSYRSIDKKLTQSLLNSQSVGKDIIRGGFSFSCLSQNGIEAEELANILFYNFFGYREKFRAAGVFGIQPVTIGEEQLIRADVKSRIHMVPVNIQIQYEGEITNTLDSYSITVLSNGTEMRQHIDYTTNWDTVTFTEAPKLGNVLRVTYKNAITLGVVDYTIPAEQITGTQTVFTMPSAIYGDRPILREIKLNDVDIS